MKSSVVFSKKKATTAETADVIRKAADKWPTTFVARNEIKTFTGGLISPGTIANLDCKGEGPEGAFKLGKNVAYPVGPLADWLISRIKE